MHIVHNSKKKYKGLSTVWMIIMVISASAIIAATTIPVEKKYKYEATLPEWSQKFNSMDTVKMAISNSDIPSRTANYVIGIINKIQTDIAAQINPQIEADKKLEKPNPSKQDSTSKKTN